MKFFFFTKLTFITVFIVMFFGGCGMTNLMEASRDGNLQVMQQEIDKGADINEESSNVTALYFAVEKGHLEAVKLLVKNGININHRPSAVFPTLAVAAGLGQFEIVKFMVDNGADTNIAGLGGWTPLKVIPFHFWQYKHKNKKFGYQYSENYLKIVKYLVDHGAKLSDLDWFDKEYYYEDAIAAKNDLLNQYNQYIAKIKDEEDTKLAKQKEQEAIQQAQLQKEQDIKKVEDLVLTGDLQTLKTLTESNPNTVYYIQNPSLRLALTGPKGLKVGDIRKLLQNGKSEKLVASLIKRVDTPYKEFTLEEIEILSKMDLSDTIISAMIDVTTELLKDEKRKKEQERLLEEQRKIAQQKTETKIIYQNTNTQEESNPVIDTLKNEAVKQIGKMLFDQLF